MHVYVRVCRKEREREGGRRQIHREVEERIARGMRLYSISPRYCYRSCRSEGICYVHCFSFAPSSKRRSRGPGIPFTGAKVSAAHHLFSTPVFCSFSFPLPSFLPSASFPFSRVLFLRTPRGFPRLLPLSLRPFSRGDLTPKKDLSHNLEKIQRREKEWKNERRSIYSSE